MLEDAEEGDLLRRVENLLEDGVEDVEVRVEVDPVRALDVSLVALLLFLEDVKLNFEIRIWSCLSQSFELVEQFQPDEFVSDTISILIDKNDIVF